MVGVASHHGDRRARGRNASGNSEPPRPTAAGRGDVPPRALDPQIGPHAERIEMLWVSGNRGDGGPGSRDSPADADPVWSPTHRALLSVLGIFRIAGNGPSIRTVLAELPRSSAHECRNAIWCKNRRNVPWDAIIKPAISRNVKCEIVESHIPG